MWRENVMKLFKYKTKRSVQNQKNKSKQNTAQNQKL